MQEWPSSGPSDGQHVHDRRVGRKRAVAVMGVVIALVGAVFTLQGAGVLGGSFMSGSGLWLLIGVGMVIAGLVLYARSTSQS